jgi:pimeloyl-ACP methyl ester carboxylesterase
MTEQRLIPTPDGRQLEVRIVGPERGRILLFHHGSPGAGLPSPTWIAAAAERDLRYVCIVRPGYGDSMRHAGRSVADVAPDVIAVLDALDAGHVLTLGISGGGPHALATAALLPDRVAAAATIGSVAPYEADGLDFLAGMGSENIEEFGAAVAGSAELAAFLEAAAPAFRTATGTQIAAAFGDLVPEVDRAALTGEMADSLAADIRASLRNGIWGWHDDDLAFTKPWGFDLASIRIPVTVWQGEQDRMVPYAHGRWLAGRIPGVHARLLAEHGHLSLQAKSIGMIFDELISGAG